MDQGARTILDMHCGEWSNALGPSLFRNQQSLGDFSSSMRTLLVRESFKSLVVERELQQIGHVFVFHFE